MSDFGRVIAIEEHSSTRPPRTNRSGRPKTHLRLPAAIALDELIWGASTTRFAKA